MNKADALSQRAIFQFLSQDTYPDIIMGKGLIKIDPLLYRREKTIFMGKICFNDAMYSEQIKYQACKKVEQLLIPDSLTNKFRYTSSEKDYGFDQSIIHQFSMLLPTKEPHIFFVEHYWWKTLCEEEGICMRVVERNYLRFRIQKNKIEFLGKVNLSNQIDFYGHGLVSTTKKDIENQDSN